MGAFRCSLCAINYANHGICRRCGGSLAWLQDEKAHTEDEFALITKQLDGEIRFMTTEEAWKLTTLLKYGLDLDRAQWATDRRDFDATLFRSLRENKCPVLMAFDICR
jgi:hypothetical protein